MASTPKPTKTTRTDWGAAKALYIQLGPDVRSYVEVSRRLRVSSVTVRKYAKRDQWVKAAADADANAARKALAGARRSREERVTKMLKIVDRAFDRFEDDIDVLDLRLADLPHLGKFAELLEGEATDRVSFGELQEALSMTVATMMDFVPKAKRPDALAAIRAKLGASGEAQAA